MDCKVSLSLDAWTSSNQHGFLAIVMHYVTNDWKLGKFSSLSRRLVLIFLLFTEELLIDFCEIIGEHSGENMAAIVWATLELYEIQNKVCIKNYFFHALN